MASRFSRPPSLLGMHQKCGNTTNDLPFVCRPNHKVSPRELGNIMSEHYEGTPDDAEQMCIRDSRNTVILKKQKCSTMDSSKQGELDLPV